jgi:hypothetical protein
MAIHIEISILGESDDALNSDQVRACATTSHFACNRYWQVDLHHPSHQKLLTTVNWKFALTETAAPLKLQSCTPATPFDTIRIRPSTPNH